MRWATEDETKNTKQTEVKSFKERLYCQCGGEFINNGWTWPTGTPGYHHICNKCEDGIAVQGKSFPRIIHVEQ